MTDTDDPVARGLRLQLISQNDQNEIANQRIRELEEIIRTNNISSQLQRSYDGAPSMTLAGTGNVDSLCVNCESTQHMLEDCLDYAIIRLQFCFMF